MRSYSDSFYSIGVNTQLSAFRSADGIPVSPIEAADTTPNTLHHKRSASTGGDASSYVASGGFAATGASSSPDRLAYKAAQAEYTSLSMTRLNTDAQLAMAALREYDGTQPPLPHRYTDRMTAVDMAIARDALPAHMPRRTIAEAKWYRIGGGVVAAFVLFNSLMAAMPVVGAMTALFGSGHATQFFASLMGIVIVGIATMVSGFGLYRAILKKLAVHPAQTAELDALRKDFRTAASYGLYHSDEDLRKHLQIGAKIRARKRMMHTTVRHVMRSDREAAEPQTPTLSAQNFVRTLADMVKQGKGYDQVCDLLEMTYRVSTEQNAGEQSRVHEALQSEDQQQLFFGLDSYQSAERLVDTLLVDHPRLKRSKVMDVVLDRLRFARIKRMMAWSATCAPKGALEGLILREGHHLAYGQQAALKSDLRALGIPEEGLDAQLADFFNNAIGDVNAEMIAWRDLLLTDAPSESKLSTRRRFRELIEDLIRHERKLFPGKWESRIGGKFAWTVGSINAVLVNSVIMMFGCVAGLSGASALLHTDLAANLGSVGAPVFMIACGLAAAIGSMSLTAPCVVQIMKIYGRAVDALNHATLRRPSARQICLTILGLGVTSSSVYYGFSSGKHIIHGVHGGDGLAHMFGGHGSAAGGTVNGLLGGFVAFFTLICAGALYVRFATKYYGRKYDAVGSSQRDTPFLSKAWLRSWFNFRNMVAGTAVIGCTFNFAWRFVSDFGPLTGGILGGVTSIFMLAAFISMSRRSLDTIKGVSLPEMPTAEQLSKSHVPMPESFDRTASLRRSISSLDDCADVPITMVGS